MTIVVAEKPRVARDIVRVLGARKQAQGFLEGNGYVVTWALEHLVHFAEPDGHGPPWSGRWSSDPLPMIPGQWRLKTARATVKQFQVVKRLINDAGTEQIVCATDAGREGENIFRLIYEHARCRKPVQRLWVSSLTRAYTVHNQVLRTIGWVPTPTLTMIVARDQQIPSFRKAFFYELVAALEEGFSAKYSRNGQTRKACESMG
jgi:DNA topoisomerase-3